MRAVVYNGPRDVAVKHRLVLTWKETGGPPVSQPTRRGFGTTLVEKLLGRSLGAEVALDYRPEGFRCRMALRLGGAGHVAAQ